MADTRYWLSIPGSKEPPKGPFHMNEIAGDWEARKIDPAATICKVGDSTWVRVDSVLGAVVSPAQPAGKPVPAPSQPYWMETSGPSTTRSDTSRGALEARYSNLASVAGSLTFHGGVLKIIGFLTIASGVVGVAVGLSSQSAAYVGFGTVGFGTVIAVMGIGIWVLGLLTAAIGEGLLALKDIAVNTRVASER